MPELIITESNAKEIFEELKNKEDKTQKDIIAIKKAISILSSSWAKENPSIS